MSSGEKSLTSTANWYVSPKVLMFPIPPARPVGRREALSILDSSTGTCLLAKGKFWGGILDAPAVPPLGLPGGSACSSYLRCCTARQNCWATELGPENPTWSSGYSLPRDHRPAWSLRSIPRAPWPTGILRSSHFEPSLCPVKCPFPPPPRDLRNLC